ncbi:MAG: DsbA family protein [Paracoccus sp. (in: a-proteobacteria)]
MEFGDYQCPYCGQAYYQLQRVLGHFGDSLRFEFRNFPLASVHPFAVLAAEAAESAGVQGKFWQMHDALYEHQSALGPDLVLDLARQLRLDVDRFINDVNSDAHLSRIRADLQDGLRLGVNGTPSFFINGRKYDGSFDAGSLIRAIEATGLKG